MKISKKQSVRQDGAPHDHHRAYQIPEACERLQISRSSLWKYAGLGRIKLIRIGGRTLLSGEELNRLLEDGLA
jgi:excisionase family DNA binding protein